MDFTRIRVQGAVIGAFCGVGLGFIALLLEPAWVLVSYGLIGLASGVFLAGALVYARETLVERNLHNVELASSLAEARSRLDYLESFRERVEAFKQWEAIEPAHAALDARRLELEKAEEDLRSQEVSILRDKEALARELRSFEQAMAKARTELERERASIRAELAAKRQDLKFVESALSESISRAEELGERAEAIRQELDAHLRHYRKLLAPLKKRRPKSESQPIDSIGDELAGINRELELLRRQNLDLVGD